VRVLKELFETSSFLVEVCDMFSACSECSRLCSRILFSVCECVTADLCLVTGGRFSSACASPILAISIGDAIDTSHLSCEICKQVPHDRSLLRIMLPGALLCVSRLSDMPDRFETHPPLYHNCSSFIQ